MAVGIYKIINIINKKVYIGQSIHIYERWKQHKSELRKNKHCNSYLQNAWNKYGENNFKFEIIEKCSVQELDEKEIYYIKCYNTFAYADNSNGYNLSTGGEGIGIVTDEIKQIFREAQQTKPIYQIDLDGKIIKRWDYGAREASTKLNISQAAIWHCVNHDRLTYKKYIWLNVNEYKNFDILKYVNQNTQSRIVLQYDMYGNFIKKWDSICQAKQFGYDVSSIAKVCKQKFSSHHGYIWCYENDVYITESYLKKLHLKDYIVVRNKNGIIIDKIDNLKEVSIKYGIRNTLLSSYLNGNANIKSEYEFEYSA